MSERHVYPGKDLEAMSFAENYHRWILDEMRPYLGKSLVEVGAGSGSFSELLLNENPEDLALVEPSEMFDQLNANIANIDPPTSVHLYNDTFAGVLETGSNFDGCDSIIYINVLEHIEDDKKELELIYSTLPAGGRCFIFVPALMALYGKFDRRIGHFRRYDKAGLEAKVASAGFRILTSKYFDFTGVAPWYVKYRLLGSDSLGSGAVTLYDKAVVPFISRIERKISPPLGKNILLIAEK